VEHRRPALPALLAEVVIETASEGEQEGDGVCGKGLVVAPAHIRDHDVALHQRVIEPRAAQARTGGADPAQLLGPGKERGRYCSVGRVSVLDVREGVVRIAEGLSDCAGDSLPDLLRPRRVDVWGQQHDFKAHGLTPLCLGRRASGYLQHRGRRVSSYTA